MRKSLWIVAILLLFAAIGAPAAHADTLYTPTFTCITEIVGTQTGACTLPPPTAPPVSFPSASITETWFIQPPTEAVIATITLLAVNAPTDMYTWSNAVTPIPNCVNCGTLIFDITDVTSGASPFDLNFPTALEPFIQDSGTLSFVPVATPVPEPSSVALMFAGIGFLLVMRKRLAQGHQPAA